MNDSDEKTGDTLYRLKLSATSRFTASSEPSKEVEAEIVSAEFVLSCRDDELPGIFNHLKHILEQTAKSFSKEARKDASLKLSKLGGYQRP